MESAQIVSVLTKQLLPEFDEISFFIVPKIKEVKFIGYKNVVNIPMKYGYNFGFHQFDEESEVTKIIHQIVTELFLNKRRS